MLYNFASCWLYLKEYANIMFVAPVVIKRVRGVTSPSCDLFWHEEAHSLSVLLFSHGCLRNGWGGKQPTGQDMAGKECWAVQMLTAVKVVRPCCRDVDCPRWYVQLYTGGASKSLARPTSRCILFDGENISFDASLYIYIYIFIYLFLYIVLIFLQLWL